MIIEYSFLAAESGMNMTVVVNNVVFCTYARESVNYIYLNAAGEKITVDKNLAELISFALRK